MKTKPKPKTKLKPKAQPEPSATAIVVRPPPPPAQIVSAVPTVLETVKNLEKVRRFISQAMNIDLKRELAKLEKQPNLSADQHNKLEQAIREKYEIDWGTIPGVDKPFLKQPGAEKFLFWLNLRPKFFKVETDIGGGHLEMVSHVIVYSKKTGEEVFEGPACSCTTMESNYRFRWAERIDREGHQVKPEQDEANRLKSLRMGRWRKKKIWAHGKYKGEEYVWEDRVDNPNIWDERNKVRQIGEKRALVKCVRNMGAVSEVFTSDPDEWDLPPDEQPDPAIDAQYTPGGRRMTIIEEEPKPDPQKVQRCAEILASQSIARGTNQGMPYAELVAKHKAKISADRAPEVDALHKLLIQAEERKTAEKAELLASPGFVYRYVSKLDKYEIIGDDAAKKEHRDLLGSFYSFEYKKILVNPEQLMDLIPKLEVRKVPFVKVAS